MADMRKGQYKKPHAINAVSVAFYLGILGLLYLGYCYGPAFLTHYVVKQEVAEAAAKYYKLSFLEKSLRARETTALMNETRKLIVNKLGFDDPEMTVELLINEETKKVNVVAQYNRVILFPGLKDKQHIMHFKAVGESDYKQNEW